MPQELQNIESCELAHSFINEQFDYKFESENPDQTFELSPFELLTLAMKDSRLAFDCGDEFVNKYVHRTMCTMSNRRKINNVVMTDNDGIQAIVAYHVAEYCTQDMKQVLCMSGNEKVVVLKFFGVNQKYLGKQMGFMLLNTLLDECLELAEKNPDYKYLVLEAFSDEACDYYERFGFKEFDIASNGGTMYALALS